MMDRVKAAVQKKKADWIAIVKNYQKPHIGKSTWQIINSLGPFLIIWVLMYFSLSFSYWLTFSLAIINAGFMVRIFIIQHDCGHNSFYKSTKANNILGSIFGVITVTPYFHWRKHHAIHHATSGDLDFRGIGDVDTITVKEYMALSNSDKFKYRFFRHPFTTFVLGPAIVFLIIQRFPVKTKKTDKKERASVYWTNIAILLVIISLGSLIGYKEFFIIQLPITLLGSMFGVYLFYVQHQFEETYWRWHSKWDFKEAALDGCSYFKLPKILQWFTGNIGFHHIHHLSPKIPNYLLEKAYKENTLFQEVKTLTMLSSIKTIFLDLWDEEHDKLISFWEYRRLYKKIPA